MDFKTDFLARRSSDFVWLCLYALGSRAEFVIRLKVKTTSNKLTLILFYSIDGMKVRCSREKLFTTTWFHSGLIERRFALWRAKQSLLHPFKAEAAAKWRQSVFIYCFFSLTRKQRQSAWKRVELWNEHLLVVLCTYEISIGNALKPPTMEKWYGMKQSWGF